MSKTIAYDGREWCHQQFYGLMTQLIKDGATVSYWRASHTAMSIAIGLGSGRMAYATGTTLWAALVMAVEKMEDCE